MIQGIVGEDSRIMLPTDSVTLNNMMVTDLHKVRGQLTALGSNHNIILDINLVSSMLVIQLVILPLSGKIIIMIDLMLIGKQGDMVSLLTIEMLALRLKGLTAVRGLTVLIHLPVCTVVHNGEITRGMEIIRGMTTEGEVTLLLIQPEVVRLSIIMKRTDNDKMEDDLLIRCTQMM